MKRNHLILKLTLLSVILCHNLFAQSQKEITLKSKLDKVSEKSEIGNLKIGIIVDTMQVRTEKGIKFTVRIKNDSTTSVLIKNPLYSMSYYLMNEKRENVAIQERSKYTIKLVGNEKYHFQGINIQKVVSKGIELTKLDMENTDTINIPPKASVEIFVNVPKVIKNKEAIDDKSRFEPVPKGKYLFSVDLGIISQQNTDIASFSPSSRPIYINYGGKN